MNTLKREKIYAHTYRDLRHLRTNMVAFIDQYYNGARLPRTRGVRADRGLAGHVRSGDHAFFSASKCARRQINTKCANPRVSQRRGSPQKCVLNLC